MRLKIGCDRGHFAPRRDHCGRRKATYLRDHVIDAGDYAAQIEYMRAFYRSQYSSLEGRRPYYERPQPRSTARL